MKMERTPMNDIRLKNVDGSQIGVIPYSDALAISKERDLDLIEVNSSSCPPIYKLGDRKKEEYLKKKARKDLDKKNRENARRTEEKTITFGPTISDNDFNIKMAKASEFIDDGHPVKIIVQIRGREVSHKDVAIPRMSKMISEKMNAVNAVIRQDPVFTGRDWIAQYVKQKETQEKEGNHE